MRRLVLLIAIPVALVLAVGIVNWRIDPFGWFYDGGPLAAAVAAGADGGAPCLVGDDAIGGVSYLDFKADVLRRRPATTTIVVGSSRTLKIGPRPGETTFSNLGFPGSGPDSLGTLFRKVRGIQDGRPLTVYLSVDFMWLNPGWTRAVEFRPSLLHRLEYVLSRSTLKASWDIARGGGGLGAAFRGWEKESYGSARCVLGRGSPGIAWRTDGVRMYAFELDPAAEPPVPSRWNGSFADLRAGQYDGYTHLDRTALRRLAAALDQARAAGWKVVGFAPPDSTFYARLFATDPRTAAAWREFFREVPALFRARGQAWLDLSDVRLVPCGQRDFVDDGWHVNAACAAKVRDRLDGAAAAAPAPAAG